MYIHPWFNGSIEKKEKKSSRSGVAMEGGRGLICEWGSTGLMEGRFEKYYVMVGGEDGFIVARNFNEIGRAPKSHQVWRWIIKKVMRKVCDYIIQQWKVFVEGGGRFGMKQRKGEKSIGQSPYFELF